MTNGVQIDFSAIDELGNEVVSSKQYNSLSIDEIKRSKKNLRGTEVIIINDTNNRSY